VGLIGKILSVFGGGSSAADPAQPSETAEPEPEPDHDAETEKPEPEPDHDAETEEPETEEAEETEEEEEDGGMSTKAVAEMADPRRRDGEDNTVHNRAENPDDQRAT